jgi:hypothetical protein
LALFQKNQSVGGILFLLLLSFLNRFFEILKWECRYYIRNDGICIFFIFKRRIYLFFTVLWWNLNFLELLVINLILNIRNSNSQLLHYKLFSV